MTLARYWWLIALRGVFALLFGIAALVVPGATLAALVLVFAVYMLVDGIFALVAGLGLTRRHQRSFALIFEGVVNLAVGVIALLWPLVTIVAFVVLMGCWAVVSGVLLCIGAFRLKLARGRWLLAAAGFISVIWGVLLLLWPLAGAIVLTWWMGGYALFFGGLLLITAFRLRALKQDSGLSETATAGA